MSLAAQLGAGTEAGLSGRPLCNYCATRVSCCGKTRTGTAGDVSPPLRDPRSFRAREMGMPPVTPNPLVTGPPVLTTWSRGSPEGGLARGSSCPLCPVSRPPPGRRRDSADSGPGASFVRGGVRGSGRPLDAVTSPRVHGTHPRESRGPSRGSRQGRGAARLLPGRAGCACPCWALCFPWGPRGREPLPRQPRGRRCARQGGSPPRRRPGGAL